jgi:hypothetical protein
MDMEAPLRIGLQRTGKHSCEQSQNVAIHGNDAASTDVLRSP